MPAWLRNIRARLADHPVAIIHGNVRDKYIDDDGVVYANLTELLRRLAEQHRLRFDDQRIFDIVGQQRTLTSESAAPAAPAAGTPPPTPPSGQGAAAKSGGLGPAPKATQQQASPARVLTDWERTLRSQEKNCFALIFYLDKLISYKAAYSPDETEVLLRLERTIENITPNNRLVMVALKDTMVPVELYENSPKCCVLPIPMPGRAQRLAFLQQRLGNAKQDTGALELLADLTDGMYLRDLEPIAAGFAESKERNVLEVRRLVLKHRIGEQEDYWAGLDLRKLDEARKQFEQLVKGQSEAIEKVVGKLVLARSGLSGVAGDSRSKPRGVMFFAGPTGVGKTYLARKLAEFLFKTNEAFLRFDMSEFKEEHTVSKLIGSPPGYVGFEEGGVLTNAVQQRPFCVILFDEVEKAHPKIMDIFLQILDEGRLTDSRGQTTFFSESVIIFTSNLGTRTTNSFGQQIDENSKLVALLGEGGREGEGDAAGGDLTQFEAPELGQAPTVIPPDLIERRRERKRAAVREHFKRSVQQFFEIEISRPELLNRIGNNIVPFNYIESEDVQESITNGHLARIRTEFNDKYRKLGHRLDVADGVARRLVSGKTREMARFGGRGIANAIEDEIMLPLAWRVLSAEAEGRMGVTFRVQLRPDGDIEVRSEAS